MITQFSPAMHLNAAAIPPPRIFRLHFHIPSLDSCVRWDFILGHLKRPEGTEPIHPIDGRDIIDYKAAPDLNQPHGDLIGPSVHTSSI